MKKRPTLSIITICYNIKDEIARTCESIVNQTWQDFEWIVVDGGSTDGTVEVLKKYQNRMSVFISEPDKGVYNAMNKGIKLAQGKWLNFMNGGDCFAANDVLEKVFKDKKYDADILYGYANVIGVNDSTCLKEHPDNISKIFLKKNTICHQASFIRKTIFKDFGLYDETLKISSDWEKFVRAFVAKRKFQKVYTVVCDFYLGGLSMNQKKINEEKLPIIQTYLRDTKIKLYTFLDFIPLLSIEEQ